MLVAQFSVELVSFCHSIDVACTVKRDVGLSRVHFWFIPAFSMSITWDTV